MLRPVPRVRTSRVLGSLVSCFVLATGALPGQQDITEAQPWQFDSFAADAGLENYRVVINNGAGSGQTVFHLHLHVIGDRPLNWPPG